MNCTKGPLCMWLTYVNIWLKDSKLQYNSHHLRIVMSLHPGVVHSVEDTDSQLTSLQRCCMCKHLLDGTLHRQCHLQQIIRNMSRRRNLRYRWWSCCWRYEMHWSHTLRTFLAWKADLACEKLIACATLYAGRPFVLWLGILEWIGTGITLFALQKSKVARTVFANSHQRKRNLTVYDLEEKEELLSGISVSLYSLQCPKCHVWVY